MKLLTAHRILISAAVLFFLFFGFWEYRNYSHTGDGWALLRAILYVAVAAAFGFYLYRLKRWYG